MPAHVGAGATAPVGALVPDRATRGSQTLHATTAGLGERALRLASQVRPASTDLPIGAHGLGAAAPLCHASARSLLRPALAPTLEGSGTPLGLADFRHWTPPLRGCGPLGCGGTTLRGRALALRDSRLGPALGPALLGGGAATPLLRRGSGATDHRARVATTSFLRGRASLLGRRVSTLRLGSAPTFFLRDLLGMGLRRGAVQFHTCPPLGVLGLGLGLRRRPKTYPWRSRLLSPLRVRLAA